MTMGDHPEKVWDSVGDNWRGEGVRRKRKGVGKEGVGKERV